MFNQQEIYLVEECGETLYGYEFKWSQTKPASPLTNWTATYPIAEYAVVTPATYDDFVLP